MRIRHAVAALAAILAAGCTGSKSPTSATTQTIGDFHGQFNGTYSIASCTADGAFAGFCEASGFTGAASLPISLSLTQTSGSVSGNVTLGSVSGTFQGSVSGSTLTGSASFADVSELGVTVTTSITSWNTTITGDSQSGGFMLTFRMAGTSGASTLTARITQLSR